MLLCRYVTIPMLTRPNSAANVSVPLTPDKIIRSKFLLFCISFASPLKYFDKICFSFGCFHDQSFMVGFGL